MPPSYLYLAYKFETGSHFSTLVHPVGSVYHPIKSDQSLVGSPRAVNLQLATVPVKAITAHVHPFGSIVKVWFAGLLKQRTEDPYELETWLSTLT